MYVCVCNAITDSDIRQAVEQGATTLPEVKRRLDGLASSCGKCAADARQIIRETRRVGNSRAIEVSVA